MNKLYEFVNEQDNENDYEYFYEDVLTDKNPPEIATCILSALNVGRINNLEELEEISELATRALDALIDYQEYPVKAAENFTKRRRSIGIGIIGLAHYFARNKVKYTDSTAAILAHNLSESMQYYLLKASNKIAKEQGACEYFHKTKYADGILPIDTYKKSIDEFLPTKLNHDWEALRNDIKEFGLRNSTLTTAMPSESSAVVSSETNGIEPPRSYLTIKKSKKGVLKLIVPGYSHLKNQYTLLWDMESMEGYLKVVAAIQKFFDQSLSANTSYNPEHHNNEIPTSVLAKDLLLAYKLGIKTLYYQNTYDGKTDDSDVEITDEEDCESCTI